MRGKYFLDTNIFVYTFDASVPAKKKRAQQLIEQSLLHHAGVTSYQVVQEFINVSSKKFSTPLTAEDQKRYLENVLLPLCEVFSTIELYRTAIDVAARHGYSFYDSLIVASAIEARCKTLFTEDLQHEHTIGNLVIINPFES